ncbi:MAG: DMT family transporter [candidate division WOR-3 bacterium]
MPFAVLAVLLWSTQATAFKIVLKYSNPFGVLLISSATSAICLFFLYTIETRKKIRDILYEIPQNLNSSLLGLVNPLLYYVVLFNAYNLLKAQEALLLNYLWPIVLTIFSAIFLKRKLSLRKATALLISFLGAVIVITKGHIKSIEFSNVKGTILALGSTILWATYWLLNMKDQRPVIQKLFYNFLFGLIYLTVIQVVFKPARIINLLVLPGGVYIGLFEMGITFFLWLKALEGVKDTARVNNLIYFAPFLSLIFINFVLRERIQFYSILGLFVISTGIILQEIFSKKGQ